MEDGDGTQSIAGGDNVQIKSGNDTIAAVGDHAIAAGGDVTITHGIPVEEHAEVLAKNKILEDKLARLNENHRHELDALKSNHAKAEREAQAKAAIEFYQQHLDRKGVEFSPEKHAEIADAAVLAGELDIAVKNLKTALEKCRIIGDEKKELRFIISLGTVYSMQTKLELAEAWLLKGLDIAKKRNDTKGISVASTDLSIIEMWRKNHTKADQYLLDALSLSRKEKDRTLEASILGNLGNNAAERGDLDAAEDYYNQGLLINRNMGKFKEISAAADNLGLIERQRKNYQKSHALHMESYLIRVELGDKIGQLYSIANLSALALETGNLEVGRNLSKEAMNMARDFGAKQIEGTVAVNLAMLAEAEGDKNRYDELIGRVRELERETGLSFLK